MALRALSLTASSSITNGTSNVTASVSLTAGRLYLVAVTTQGVNTTDRQVPTVTGAGQTWDLVSSTLFSTFSAGAVFRCMPTANNSGALTITNTLTQDTVAWIVVEVDDLATGLPQGANGANAIGTVAVATPGSGTTLTASPTFTKLRNGTLSINFWDKDAGGGAVTANPGAGFAESAEANANDGGVFGSAVQIQFNTANDTSADVTWSLSGFGLGAIAFEVKTPDDPAAVSGVRSAYPWVGGTWGSWGWLGSPTATGSPYTLVYDAATYSVSAQAIELDVGRRLSFDPVSYSLAVQPIQLNVGKRLSFDPQIYVYSAQDIKLDVGRRLSFDAVSYNLNAVDVTLTYTPNAGAFTLVYEPAAYTLGAQAIELNVGRRLSFDAQSYALNAVAIELDVGRRLSFDPQSYALNPVAVELDVGRRLSFDPQSYAVNAQPVTLTYTPNVGAYQLVVDPVAYLVGANEWGLIYSGASQDNDGGGSGKPEKRYVEPKQFPWERAKELAIKKIESQLKGKARDRERLIASIAAKEAQSDAPVFDRAQRVQDLYLQWTALQLSYGVTQWPVDQYEAFLIQVGQFLLKQEEEQEEIEMLLLMEMA